MTITIYEKLDARVSEEVFSASLNEFSKGYKIASTNKIASECSISKGSLFNYFTNKETLFLETLKKSVEIVYSYIDENIDIEITDFFQKLRSLSKIKDSMTKSYPKIIIFLEKILQMDDCPLKEKVKPICFSGNMEKFYTIMDNSTTRELLPGVEFKTLKELVVSMSNGLSYSYLVNSLSQDEVYIKFNEYIDLLEKIIYKEK